MEKKVIVLLITSIFVLSVLPCFSSALGISPARTEINFEPNEVHEIYFNIFHAKNGGKVTVYAEGELAKYVTLDKAEIQGEGRVKATIRLPSQIDTPGENLIYITAAEEPPQNVFIGTAIRVKARITVHVPYPGKYIETELKVPNGNADDKIPVELGVISRGTEEVMVNPVITFYDSSMRVVDMITFNPVTLKTNEQDYFRRYLDTTGWAQGSYFAEAVIDYNGEKIALNTTFKVGTLSVSVTDFTKNISEGEINKFFINVKSNWNDNLEGIYADVFIYNESSTMSFRTPQIELKPWEEKTIDAYFDAQGIKPGEYNLKIELHYSGQTTFAMGKLLVIGKPESSKTIFTVSVVAGLIALLVVAGLIAKIIKRKKRKKSKAGRK